MLNINGEVRYEFFDLVSRSGHYVASVVWDEMSAANRCGRWIDTETGEESVEEPTPIDRRCLLDETAWDEVCVRADQVASRAGALRNLGKEIWRP